MGTVDYDRKDVSKGKKDDSKLEAHLIQAHSHIGVMQNIILNYSITKYWR